MKYYLPLSLAFLCLGCKTILLEWNKVRNPKMENTSSITKFAREYELDTTNILVLKDSAELMQRLKDTLHMPYAYFFNRNNEFIDFRKTPKECTSNVGSFISSIDSISNMKASSPLLLNNFVKGFITLRSHQPITIDNSDKYEITIITTSAKYMGKLNKGKVFDWEDIVLKLQAAGHKIRYYKVFYDYMDFWGVKKEDMYRIR